MSIPSAAGSVESPPIAPRTGTNESPGASDVAVSDDMLYEVVDGKIVEKEFHAYEAAIASILVDFLGSFAQTTRLGRVFAVMLFRIDQVKNLQRRPDVAFVSHAKWPVRRRLPHVEAWDMVPDLAIEIVNPTDTADQVQETIHDYFNAGVTAVWVVYPEQQEVYVYASPTQIQVLQLGQDLDGGDLIPGFRLSVATLFEDEAE